MKSGKLRTLGYLAFGSVALVVSFYLTFPAQAVGQRMAHEVHRRTRGKVSFQFADAAPYRFSGVAAEGVRLTLQRDGGKEPVVIELDALQARVKLLPLLLLRPSVYAHAEAGDGEITLHLSLKGDGASSELEIEALNLASPPVLPGLVGLPLAGSVTASGAITWAGAPFTPEGQLAPPSEGALELRIDGAGVGPGAVAGFTLPSIGLGALALSLEVKDKKLRVSKWEQSGGQAQIQLSGEMALRPTFASSTLDACAQLKLDEAFADKNEKLKTAMQFGAVRFKKDPKGFLNIPFRGAVSGVRIEQGLCRSRG